MSDEPDFVSIFCAELKKLPPSHSATVMLNGEELSIGLARFCSGQNGAFHPIGQNTRYTLPETGAYLKVQDTGALLPLTELRRCTAPVLHFHFRYTVPDGMEPPRQDEE